MLPFLYSIGSCVLAGLGAGRNVLAVEKDRWQFLHSQMRAVNSLSGIVPSEAAEMTQGNEESVMDTASAVENLETVDTCPPSQ